MRRARRPLARVAVAVILDADGLTKLARRDRRVREMVRQEVVERRGVLVVPPVVVVQALAEGISPAAIDEILLATLESGMDRRRLSLAATLIRATARTDVIDALVAAEALLQVPSIVITSDPADIRVLLDSDERGQRVEVWGV